MFNRTPDSDEKPQGRYPGVFHVRRSRRIALSTREELRRSRDSFGHHLAHLGFPTLILSGTFSSLIRRLRRRNSAYDAEVEAYLEHIAPVRERVEAMYADWVTLTRYERDEERLANTAAINRWETVRLMEDAEDFQPPTAARGEHRALQAGIRDATRAWQLLSTGYRYHHSDSVCDGQVLLDEAVQLAVGTLPTVPVLD